MAAYIYLKSVAKNYNGKSVLADLNLGLERGSSLAVVGKNNSGKSMLLKILAKQERTSGQGLSGFRTCPLINILTKPYDYLRLIFRVRLPNFGFCFVELPNCTGICPIVL